MLFLILQTFFPLQILVTLKTILDVFFDDFWSFVFYYYTSVQGLQWIKTMLWYPDLIFIQKSLDALCLILVWSNSSWCTWCSRNPSREWRSQVWRRELQLGLKAHVRNVGIFWKWKGLNIAHCIISIFPNKTEMLEMTISLPTWELNFPSSKIKKSTHSKAEASAL